VLPDFLKSQLPPGVHAAGWAEIRDKFGGGAHREHLLDGLRVGGSVLKAVGCPTLWLDGSFVTEKPDPNDFDACWETAGVDIALLRTLDPVMLTFDHDRLAQRMKYGGEFFPNVREGASGLLFQEFFQRDKTHGGAKGIVELDLRSFSP